MVAHRVREIGVEEQRADVRPVAMVVMMVAVRLGPPPGDVEPAASTPSLWSMTSQVTGATLCTATRVSASRCGKASRRAAANMSPAAPPMASRWMCMSLGVGLKGQSLSVVQSTGLSTCAGTWGGSR
jgi:hypothetical protein